MPSEVYEQAVERSLVRLTIYRVFYSQSVIQLSDHVSIDHLSATIHTGRAVGPVRTVRALSRVGFIAGLRRAKILV